MYPLKLTITLTILAISTLLVTSCADINDEDGDAIQKYLGEWNVSDQSARINYKVTIIANPSNSSEILLQNFADLGNTAVALVIGNSLAIDSQQLGKDYTVNGSGSYINSSKIVINFDLNDGIDEVSRIATFTK